MRNEKLYKPLLLWLAFIAMLPLFSNAQTVLVKGIVKDASGSPLQGVGVVVKGKTSGTSTSADGSFTLQMPDGKSVLVFSSIGFKTKEIDTKGQTTVTVILEENKAQLAEVVVVGYGTQKKSDVTGAISSIKNKEFKDQPVSNLASSIAGKLSGINVTQPSGTPGAGLLVSIRGAQNPLYVVDGIPMLSESNSSLGTSYNTTGESVGNGQNVSSISDINPNDIESIEVLKDASSAAIYGARAANGVVLITTKRGKSGKTSIDFNYYTGFQKVVKKIPFLNSQQFYDLTKEAIANDIAIYKSESAAAGKDSSRYGELAVLQGVGIVDAIGNAIPNAALPFYNLASGVNTNWLNEIFQTAPISNYEISARGGNEKTKFYVGGGYFDQTGIIINNYYRRYNFRLNVDNQATDRLLFGTTISASRSDNKRSFNDNTYTGIVTNALGASPLMPVYESPGVYADFNNYQAYWLSDNPVKSAKEINANTVTNRFLGSVYGEYKIAAALKFRTTLSVDYNDVNDKQYFSPLTTDAQPVGGKLLVGQQNSLTWLNENTLNFQQKVGKSNFNVLAGFTQQSTTVKRSAIQGTGFPQTGSAQDISVATNITRPILSSPVTVSVLHSVLARLNYDYDGKYLLTINMRSDASSRFPKNNRVAYFPSTSIGWNLSRENFLANSKIVNALKLRASYGVTGDQEIPDYKNLVTWKPTRYNGAPGLVPLNLTAPELSWQRNATFNIGTDFDLFNHFINGSVEYFVSERSKLLGLQPISRVSGFTDIYTNSGKIEDKGWEFQLGSNNIQTKDFTWTSSFNISFLTNKIKALAVDNQYISAYNDQSPTHILKVGEAVGTFIGVRFAGVNTQTGDAEYYSNEGKKIRADEVDFTRDATIIGSARPKFFGGFSNSFKYKNFDLLIAMQFSYGNKTFNIIRNTYESIGWSGASDAGSAYLGQVYANNDTRVLNRWRKPGDKTDIPRASFLAQNYVSNSDQFLEDGSYLKLRTVNLGYTIRKTKCFNSVRVYAQAQNLFTISKYIGFDPEVSSTGGGNDQTAGIDYAAYPPARTFTFGLNINL